MYGYKKKLTHRSQFPKHHSEGPSKAQGIRNKIILQLIPIAIFFLLVPEVHFGGPAENTVCWAVLPNKPTYHYELYNIRILTHHSYK